MSLEPMPPTVQPTMEPPILRQPDMVAAAAVPILDQRGQEILDQAGRVIYGVR